MMNLVLALLIPLQAKAPPERPAPTVADYVYGRDSERQKFDFWQAKSEKPTPVVLLIHGGGWVNGDKARVSGLERYLAAGISVVSINYRFVTQAIRAGVEIPPNRGPKGCLCRKRGLLGGLFC